MNKQIEVAAKEASKRLCEKFQDGKSVQALIEMLETKHPANWDKMGDDERRAWEIYTAFVCGYADGSLEEKTA